MNSKMRDKDKNNSDNSKANKRLLGITAIIVAAVLAIYGISIIVGGGFHEFCEGAIIWVLAGIGIAAYFAYCNQKSNKTRE